MAAKRKLRAGKLGVHPLFAELETEVRRRYGDENEGFARDELLINEFCFGHFLCDENNRIVETRYLKSGSARERKAMKALAEALTLIRDFIRSEDPEFQDPTVRLGQSVLSNLATMIDPDRLVPRKLAAKTITKHERWSNEIRIAREVAREVKAGTQVTAAKQLVAERFGYSAKMVERFCVKHKRQIESAPRFEDD